MCRSDSPRSTATPYLHENTSLLFKTEPPISFVSSALLTFCGLVCNLSIAHTIPLIFNSSSSKIFEYASYNYDDPSDGRRRVYFDNTWMTFATDYALALEMALIIAYICRTSRRSPIRDGTVGLLACYGLSVVVGERRRLRATYILRIIKLSAELDFFPTSSLLPFAFRRRSRPPVRSLHRRNE